MKYIHLIGICGTGMGSLAGLFKEAGFKVSGSDTQFYPPMGDQIKALEIKLYTGFDPENLAEKPDIVIIGNVCRADNPEAVEALKLKIKYYSLPQALQEFFLKNKKAIVVAGTHGKTTTTCLLAWVLTSAGLDPGFLIGGVGLNLGKSFQLGKGDYFVVEGDEYDSAFFDKGPKFAHYKPAGAILTSLEWDHVDIYPTFEKMFGAFEKLTATLSEKTPLLAWMDSPKITELTHMRHYPLFRYGLSHGDYTAQNIKTEPAGTSFQLCCDDQRVPLFVPLSGRANLENTIAVAALCHRIGLSWEQIAEGLKTFQGIKRRQEIRGTVKGVTVIDDFAHHPTAIRRTIEALKERFPKQRLTAVFEPRSNTSRRNAHYDQYLKAFKGADKVILAPVYNPEKIPAAERLDTAKLADDLMKRGIDAYAVDGTDFIIEFILRGIGPNEVVAFFSNGDFDNIHEKLLDKLSRRKIFEDKKQVRSIKIRT
ncbi:MAG: UDP-N-acetylmuramate--L-alanine ligase [Deltaproteobacteria bacterium]|nr:UDP-N-acetylmuramate--L-alanine ligase [Deltaproteobacteria bacterium]